MNQLITMSLTQADSRYLSEFPPELLYENEKLMVDYILGYERRHKKLPSVDRLMEAFSHFIPFVFTPSLWSKEEPPISDVCEQQIAERLVEYSDKNLRLAQKIMADETRVPLDLLRDIERVHTLSLGVMRYSTFDRDVYFRRSVEHLPFEVIDNHIGGLANGDYMLLIGRLGTGKSTVAQWLAKSFWEQGKKVLFVSAEMLGIDVFAKIDSMVGKFNPLELRSSRSSGLDATLSIVSKTARAGRGEIIIPKLRLLDSAQIGAFAQNLQIDVVFVDGVYLLYPSTGSYSSKWERVATVSNELKQTALELNLPLIGTAQIKRGASGEDGYDPEDIAFSDALGQDSDFVLAIHPNPIVRERAELQLIKNRYGPLCATQIHIDYDKMQIIDETKEGAVGEVELEKWEDWTK